MPESTQIISYNSEYTLSSSIFSSVDSNKIIKSAKLYIKLTDSTGSIGPLAAGRMRLFYVISSNTPVLVDASNCEIINNEPWLVFDVTHSLFDYEHLVTNSSYYLKNLNNANIEIYTGSSLHLDVEYFNEHDSDSRNIINVEIPEFSLVFNHQTQHILLKRNFYNGLLPYDVSLVFSSKLKNKVVFSNPFPRGWKLNLLDYLNITSIGGVVTSIVFVDKNNVEHPLTQLSNKTDTWYTTDGSALILEVKTSGSAITYELHNELSNARKVFNSSGQIISYTNEDEKTISFSYSFMSTTITDYNNNVILISSDKAGNLSITLNNGLSYQLGELLGTLTSITYDNNAYTESFAYDSDWNLISVTSFDSHIINVSYSNRRVNSINKYFTTLKEEEYSFSYKFLRTVITSISGVKTYFSYNTEFDISSTGEVDDNDEQEASIISSKELLKGEWIIPLTNRQNGRTYWQHLTESLSFVMNTNSTFANYLETKLISESFPYDQSNFFSLVQGKSYLLLVTLIKQNNVSFGGSRLANASVCYYPGASEETITTINFDENLEKQTKGIVFKSPTTENGAYVSIRLNAQGFYDFNGITFTDIQIIDISGARTNYYSTNSYTSAILPPPFPSTSIPITIDSKLWYMFTNKNGNNTLPHYSYKDLIRNYLNVEKGNQFFWDNDLHHLTYNPYPNNNSTNGGYINYWHRNIQGSNSIYAKRTVLKQYIDSNNNLKEVASFEYLESFIDNNKLFFRLTSIKQVGDDSYKNISIYDENFKLVREEKSTGEYIYYDYDQTTNNLSKVESGNIDASWLNKIYRTSYAYDSIDRLTQENSLSSNNIETKSTSYVDAKLNLISGFTDEANNQESYTYDNYYRYMTKIEKGNSEINKLYVSNTIQDISNDSIFRIERVTVDSTRGGYLYKIKTGTNSYAIFNSFVKNNHYDNPSQYPNSLLEVQRYKFKYYYDKYNHVKRFTKLSGTLNNETQVAKFYYFDKRPDDIEDTSITTFSEKSTSKAKLYRIDDNSGYSFYNYNGEDRLIQTKVQYSSSIAYQIDYEYDFLNRLNYYETSFNGSSFLETYIEYENSNSDRLINISHSFNNGSTVSEEYSYDKLSRKSSTVDEIIISNSKKVYKKEFEYYSKDIVEGNKTIHLQSPLLKRVDYYGSLSSLPTTPPTYIYNRSTHISYDSKGNITSIKDGTQTTPTSSSGVNYEYDVNNRLTREDNYELNETIRYNYDDNGNITSVTHSDLNSSVINSTDTYSYNNKYKDKLVSFNNQSIAYSDYLNPTSFGTKSFTWVGERWLSSITDSSNSLDVRYTYNSNGIRTKKQFYITLAGNTMLKRTVNLYLDGNRVIRESSSDLAYGGQTYTLTFLYSQEGAVGFIKDGDFYRYEKNILGDIVAIYQGISLIAKYVYDAYGNHKVYNGSNQEITYASNPTHIGIINPFRYRGYYYDNESNLYYCNSRYYSPELRRWLNIDDISYLSPENIDGINLFAYCLNNPVMNVDPDGNSVIATIVALVFGALVGALIGAIGGTFVSLVQDLRDNGLIDLSIGEKQYLANVISGAITGAALGLSGAAGGEFLMPLFNGTGSIIASLFGGAISSGVSFAGGYFGYCAEQSILGNPIDKRKGFIRGGLTIIEGIFAYGAGGISALIKFDDGIFVRICGRVINITEKISQYFVADIFGNPIGWALDMYMDKCL